MDIFDFLKEMFKGIIRAMSAHLFQKHILDKKKTTQCHRKRGVFETKTNVLTTTT